MLGAVTLLFHLAFVQGPTPQSDSSAAAYTLNVSTNEVRVLFHAVDAHDQPVDDLKPDEIELFDNEQGPGQIAGLQLVRNRPMRVVFLIDRSSSMQADQVGSRDVVQEAVRTLPLGPNDLGAVYAFKKWRYPLQKWTNRNSDMEQGLRTGGESPNGTGIFDSLLLSCTEDFSNGELPGNGNAILLFSDGEDTTSKAELKAAVGKCRDRSVAIYSFSPNASLHELHGDETLQSLADETGGRLFFTANSVAGVHTEMETVASDLRSEYMMFYKPKQLAHDGAYHQIVLVGPSRVRSMVGTTGFYDARPVRSR
jgi:Ca-activated chloride channel family protein